MGRKCTPPFWQTSAAIIRPPRETHADRQRLAQRRRDVRPQPAGLMCGRGQTTGIQIDARSMRSMAGNSIANIVRRFAAETPDGTAIKFGSRRVSWRELDQRSTRAAAGLQASGISRQQRVAFLAKNCLEYFEVLFGAAKLNAVVVAVNWRLAPAEIAYTINDAGANVLIVGPDFFGTVADSSRAWQRRRRSLPLASTPSGRATRTGSRLLRRPIPQLRCRTKTFAHSSTPAAPRACRRA